MFYTTEVSPLLRFGDVVNCFFTATPIVNNPSYRPKVRVSGESFNCNVEIESDYHVIMTPTCSIHSSAVLLAPLKPLRKSFFNNKYIADNPVIINGKMPERFVYSEDKWNDFPPEKKEEIASKDDDYQLKELFIYDKSDDLPVYPLRLKGGIRITITYRMIDFRSIFRLECNEIPSNRPEDIDINSGIMRSKVLEPSISTRDKLRKKMAHYFGRIEEEDLK